MSSIKPGVNILGLQPQMVLAFFMANEVYEKHGVECVMTSALDGKHSAYSHHYKGFAIDLRTVNIGSEEKTVKIADEIQDKIGKQYQVIVEINHIHIEFDPVE